MTKFRPVSHVIFDMDGTILDSEPLYTKAVQNVVSKYGKTFTWELKSRMMGLSRSEASKFVTRELDLPISWEEYDTIVHEVFKTVLVNPPFIPGELLLLYFLDTEMVYKSAMEQIAKQFGKNCTNDIVAKILGAPGYKSAQIAVAEMNIPMCAKNFHIEIRNIAHTILATQDVSLMTGAQELVHHFIQHKIPISVATSSSLFSFELKTAGHKDFFKLFDHIVLGSTDPDVKLGKPAPDIFLVSAARFPDKPNPANCLVFEDAPNGVQAALNAGMQVVMLPDENLPMDFCNDATLVVRSLLETPLEKFGLPPLKQECNCLKKDLK